MFKKSIMVLLKSGLKVITTYDNKATYEHNLEYLLDYYKDYVCHNDNDVLMLLNDSGEMVYFTAADIVNIVTFNTPERTNENEPQN